MYNANTSDVHTCTVNDANASTRIALPFCVFEAISHALPLACECRCTVVFPAVASLSSEKRQAEICLHL